MNLMMDKATYQANAQVLTAAHLMLGTVMDVLDTPLRS
jgi:flagellar hook-associated protein FlgK